MSGFISYPGDLIWRMVKIDADMQFSNWQCESNYTEKYQVLIVPISYNLNS